MNLFLQQLSKQFPNDIILLCCNGAAWHKSQSLVAPDNIVLFFLPPYMPEMDPIEQIWKAIRMQAFYHVNFPSLGKVMDRLSDVICSLSPARIPSITCPSWILNCFIEV